LDLLAAALLGEIFLGGMLIDSLFVGEWVGRKRLGYCQNMILSELK